MTPTTPLSIVITGGSSGIGADIVNTFSLHNHHIFYTYHSHPPINPLPTNVIAHYLDQGNPHSILELLVAVRSWLHNIGAHKLDVLINNAALGSATVKSYVQRNYNSSSSSSILFTDLPSSHLTYTDQITGITSTFVDDIALMQVNALGPLWVTQSLLPFMMYNNHNNTTTSCLSSSRSIVVFIGSVGGGTAVFPEYTPADLMSKAAISYLTRHLAATHIHSPIDIICLSPGATRTPMFQLSTLQSMSMVEQNQFVNSMPKNSLIEPNEIAQCLLTIITSSWSRILHGSCIDASLGLGIRPGLQTEFSTVPVNSISSSLNSPIHPPEFISSLESCNTPIHSCVPPSSISSIPPINVKKSTLLNNNRPTSNSISFLHHSNSSQFNVTRL